MPLKDKTKQLEYIKKWRKDNPEKIKVIGKRYVESHREKMNKYAREWRKKNPDKVRESRKRSNLKRKKQDLMYSRMTRLGTYKDGKRVNYYRMIKGKYPKNSCCELCKEKYYKRLAYHHWDDQDLENGKIIKGLWLCWKCHMFITLMEKYPKIVNEYNKYLKIKKNYGKQII